MASHSGVISEEGLEGWLDVNLFSNDELLKCESVDVVGSMTKNKEKQQQQVNKREGGGEVGEEVVAKRGFVSFASQFGRDDYALSSY